MPNNNPIENLQMKFYKDLLGVQKQTTNNGVMLELGQVPLNLQANKNAIKNWSRITNDPKCNKLVTSSYDNGISNNLSWTKIIKDTFAQIGMLSSFFNKDGRAHEVAFQRMRDIFHQNSFAEIQKQSSKLRTYSLFKTQIGFENYLSEIQNVQSRTSLTKLRLSNHSLMIETGRHQHIEKDLRFCPFCPGKIEDESHFLLECQVYKPLRDELFEETKTRKEDFIQMRSPEKMLTLVTNPTVYTHTASYINRTFCIREYLLSKHKNHT